MLFLLELILMIAAPIMHFFLCMLSVAGRIKMSVVPITLISLITGIALPVLASYMDIINLPDNVKCATGSVGFACLGALITVVTVPVVSIIFFIIVYHRRKKLML